MRDVAPCMSPFVSQNGEKPFSRNILEIKEHSVSTAYVIVTDELYPCELCGMPCVAPRNEPEEVLRLRGSRCAVCAPGWVAKRFHTNAHRSNFTKAQVACPVIAGVYIVELVTRPCVVKIGQSVNIWARLATVYHKYGPVDCLYVIPTTDPRGLERQLHCQLNAFRLYDAGSKSELFEFVRRKAQQAFLRILHPYEALWTEAPSWQRPGPTSDLDVQQMSFL